MENQKKIVLAMAAVTAYIKTEEEARRIMSAHETISRQEMLPLKFWGMSGRQTMMQQRNLMQMKTFQRTAPR